MKNIKEKITELIFPSGFTCNFCGREIPENSKHILCDNCLKSIEFMPEKICKRCGGAISGEEKYCIHCKTRSPNFTLARAPLIYKGKISNEIKTLKYSNRQYLAKTFAYFMSMEYYKSGFVADIIVPIPLHAKRLKSRGFNQSKLLADEISKIIDVKVVDALERTRATRFQAKLDYEERQKNLDGCFNIKDKDVVKGKKILLIDDIYTTGSTLNHASEVLRKAKCGKIFALTITHTIID